MREGSSALKPCSYTNKNKSSSLSLGLVILFDEVLCKGNHFIGWTRVAIGTLWFVLPGPEVGAHTVGWMAPCVLKLQRNRGQAILTQSVAGISAVIKSGSTPNL